MPDAPRDEPTEDARPWERLGVMRRDCEPERGAFLWVVALAACALIPAAPVAFALGAWVWAQATRDLRRMAEGRMDRAGERYTGQALTDAVVAMLFGGCATAGGVALLGLCAVVNLLGIR